MNENIKEFILNNSYNSTNVTNISNYTSSFIDNSSSSFLNISITTTIIPQIDPNWFYSASAQSAAAIVGLMGAFLTTKVLNQKLYVKQLKNEIYRLKSKNDHILNEIEQIDNRKKEILSDEEIKYCKSIDNTFNPSNTQNSYTLYKLKKGEAGPELVLKLEKYEKCENDKNIKMNELFFINDVLENKSNQLLSNKDILDSKKLLISLAIFSVLGVFLPLAIMLLDFDIMVELRSITFFLIFIGWAYILFALGCEIRNLKD